MIQKKRRGQNEVGCGKIPEQYRIRHVEQQLSDKERELIQAVLNKGRREWKAEMP